MPALEGQFGSAGGQRWLLFMNRHRLGQGLAARLRAEVMSAAMVEAGKAFEEQGGQPLHHRTGRGEYYAELLRRLHESGGLPDRVIHLWMVAAEPPGNPSLASSPAFALSQSRLLTGRVIDRNARSATESPGRA